MPGPSTAFGERLRHLRLRAGLSQEALAERAGLAPRAIAALESGDRRSPYARTLGALGQALELSAAERADLANLADQRSRLRAAPQDPDAPDTASNQWPAWPTSFIGRHLELESVRKMLDPAGSSTRLLTLVGPGGVGKTRLAIAAAAALAPAYTDGAHFVDLAPLHDARLVPATIARAVGVRESGGRSARDLLLEHLREQHALLVLDNFEHVLDARLVVAELLRGCQRVTLLVTSRTALRVQGELRSAVAPLPIPPMLPEKLGKLDVTAWAAVQLFVERAQAMMTDFTLTEPNAAAVAEICRRLDGIPLALELAAARVPLLPPESLLRRLEHRLPMLTSGAADVPERQQTLRSTLAWSYELLEPVAQMLFRRLAVFASGWTLAAAEAVCPHGPLQSDNLLDQLQALVDSSLVRRLDDSGDDPRFGMLETVREYALEQLETSGEADAVRRRHAIYFVDLAETAEPELYGSAQVAWLERLEHDHANLRAVLEWGLSAGVLDTALRLASALRLFWYVHGYHREGCDWLGELLEHPGGRAPTLARARALNAAGYLQSTRGDYIQARLHLADALAIGHASGDAACVAFALRYLGMVANAEGDARSARAYLEESLAHYRQTGARPDIALVLMYLADAVQLLGDQEQAERLYAESAALLRALDNAFILPYPLRRLAYLALRRGDARHAAELCLESLALNRRVRERQGIAASLVGLAEVADSQGDPEQAARLLGAADRLLTDLGSRLLPLDRERHSQTEAAVSARLGDSLFAALREVGQGLSLDDVAAAAETMVVST